MRQPGVSAGARDLLGRTPLHALVLSFDSATCCHRVRYDASGSAGAAAGAGAASPAFEEDLLLPLCRFALLPRGFPAVQLTPDALAAEAAAGAAAAASRGNSGASARSASGAGFGAGGRVGKGVNAGVFGWGGAAGTVAFVDPRRKLRAICMAQYMPSNVYPIHADFAKWVLKDLGLPA
jgi:CubicO group peptidase (beta-lactamase class C family)